MKIKKKDSPEKYVSIGANKEVNAELVDSSDRVAGILGATIVDIRLERMLRQFFVDDDKEASALLSNESPNSPISSFSARARTSYCLGLISKEELQDIDTVRAIRNICAHHMFDCSFEQPKLKAACDGFRIFSYLMAFPAATTTRVRFNIAIGVLDGLLDARSKDIMHRGAAIPFRGATKA
jgi:DNA-binding MltR family transcriptional regulator